MLNISIHKHKIHVLDLETKKTDYWHTNQYRIDNQYFTMLFDEPTNKVVKWCKSLYLKDISVIKKGITGEILWRGNEIR